MYVTPLIKGQKNDYNDAEAIAEAALRPNLRIVEEKTQDQLDLQALHRVLARAAVVLYAFAEARREPVLCRPRYQADAQVEDDFEKGEADRTIDSVSVIVAAAKV